MHQQAYGLQCLVAGMWQLALGCHIGTASCTAVRLLAASSVGAACGLACGPFSSVCAPAVGACEPDLWLPFMLLLRVQPDCCCSALYLGQQRKRRCLSIAALAAAATSVRMLGMASLPRTCCAARAVGLQQTHMDADSIRKLQSDCKLAQLRTSGTTYLASYGKSIRVPVAANHR